MNKSTVLSEKQCRELPHVAICLLGKFKGEGGDAYHVINVANESQSGLQPRWWIEKLVEVCESEGRRTGPAFASPDGKLAVPGDYDAVFRQYLTEVQEKSEFIDKTVDVDAWYNLSRTPRKTTITRMKRAGLGKDAEDMARWKTVENAKGRRPRFNMRHLYSEACLLMPVTWTCSYFL